MMNKKSQMGYEYILIAGSVIVFFFLGSIVIYNVIGTNSNQSTVLASKTNLYTNRGVDCNTQKVKMNWNDAQLADCVNNYFTVAATKQNCTQYGVLDNSKIRGYYSFTHGSKDDTLGLSDQDNPVNTDTPVGWPNDDKGHTFGDVDYIPAPNTNGFHITSFHKTNDWNGDFAFAMWTYFLTDADISLYNSTHSSFGNSAAYISYTNNTVSFGTKTTTLIQYGPVHGWFHVMITRVNTNLSLYVNGSLVNSTTFTGGFGSITGMQLWRGANYGGVMDEIKFYSGTITSAMAGLEFNCIRSQDS